jgi:hypothetical protein
MITPNFNIAVWQSGFFLVILVDADPEWRPASYSLCT